MTHALRFDGGNVLARARSRLAKVRALRRAQRARCVQWRPVAGGYEAQVGPWRLRVEASAGGWRWAAFLGRRVTARGNGTSGTLAAMKGAAIRFARGWRSS